MRPNIIYSNGEIDFSSLRSIIFSKRGRNISLITVLSALLLTYIFLLTSTKEFLVTAKIAPVESVAMGSSASNAAGTMSSFGSMLGIDLGGTGSSSNYEKFKEIFASERMAQIFIELRDPRPHIFGDGFNPETGIFDALSLKTKVKQFIYFMLGRNYVPLANAKSLAAYIDEEISIFTDRKTNFITLSMHTDDPSFGMQFMSDLVFITDLTIKNQQRLVIEQSIDYLQNQLYEVGIDRHRAAIGNAITSQEIQMSILTNDTPYAAEFIQPPSSTAMPVTPMIGRSIMLAFFLSLLFSIYFIIHDYFWPIKLPVSFLLRK